MMRDLALLATGLLGVVACVLPDADLSGLPCPCVDGFTCDAATQTCVPASGGSASGAGNPGGAPSGGASSGGAASGGATQGGGGAAGGGATGGAGGGVEMLCGNGTIDPGEECDPPDAAVCSPSCLILPENCSDSVDNDNDGFVDCEDQDCVATCVAACNSSPTVMAGQTLGDNGNTPDVSKGNCTGAPGREVSFLWTANYNGALFLELGSPTDQVLYVRRVCDDPNTEVACQDDAGGNNLEYISIPVLSGESYAIFVDSFELANAGLFDLTLIENGLDEIEPNNDASQASPWVGGLWGARYPAGDDDWYTLTVPGPSSEVTIITKPIHPVNCEFDSEVELYAPDGATSLGYNDDNGSNGCSNLVVPGLAAGTYFIRVGAPQENPPVSEFTYELAVAVQ